MSKSISQYLQSGLLALGILLWLPGILAAEKTEEAPIDSIVATVNDEVITSSELDEYIAIARANMRKRKIKLPPENMLRRQVLKQTIMERLQLQVAKQIGIQVDEEDIDSSVKRVMESNKLSKAAFARHLAADGLTVEKYREQVKNQLIIQQLLEREVKRRIIVSESEVDALLEQQLINSNDAYHISHILLPLPESATPEIITAHQQRANDLVERLRSGESFSALAASHSQGREALEGGVLGWKQAGQLPELFLEALTGMKKGGISEPLRSANGFHILKMNDIKTSKKSRTVTQSRVRHILIKTNKVMPEAEARNKIQLLRQRLEAGDDFAHVAQSYSDDPGSAAKGGELGWVNPGQTVPAFEKAVQSLPIGKLSQPVKSVFGYHLIEVLERRQKDIGDQLDRAQAREQLSMRKADDRYQQWLSQLESEAYIQIMADDKPL